MAESSLTAARAREVLRYDSKTGLLFWIHPMRFGHIATGSEAGTNHKSGYRNVYIDRLVLRAHRVAWLIFHGKWPDGDIDHINGVKSDNRMCNLRDVTHRHNQENRRSAQKNNASGYLGVRFRNQKWGAEIQINGKNKNLGRFDTPEAAHSAYLDAKRKMHQGCTI